MLQGARSRAQDQRRAAHLVCESGVLPPERGCPACRERDGAGRRPGQAGQPQVGAAGQAGPHHALLQAQQAAHLQLLGEGGV